MDFYDKIPDIVILVLLAGGAFDGFTKGLSEELLNVILTVIGLLLSSIFYMPAADLLVTKFSLSGPLLYGLSFLGCLLVFLILLKVIKAILKKKVDFSFGTFVERFFGGVAGAAKMLVFVCAVILAVSIWRNEMIYKYVVEKSKIGSALSRSLEPVYKKVREKIPEKPAGETPAHTNAPDATGQPEEKMEDPVDELPKV